MKNAEIEMSSEEKSLKSLIATVRAVKAESNARKEAFEEVKDQLRIFMIDSNIKEYDGVEIRRQLSFDLELLRIEHLDIFEKYCDQEEKTVFKNTWKNKKMKALFMRDNPDISMDPDYRSEKTAGVYGL